MPTLKAIFGDNRAEKTGRANVRGVMKRFYGADGADRIDGAIKRARAAGVPWLQIFAVLVPFIMQLFSGDKIDIQKIIEAILALLNK